MDSMRFLARRLLFLFALVFGMLGLLFIGLITYRPAPVPDWQEPVPAPETKWKPRLYVSDSTGSGPLVRRGYLLVSQSATQMGPRAEDPEMRYGGNNLSCTNCHLDAGTRAGSASWVGVAARFPQFGGRSNRIGTLEDRINGCMERSMNGRKLETTSEPMKAIVAYMAWVSDGLPAGREEEFSGYPPIQLPETAVDLGAGKAVYSKECALCHGADGQGTRHAETYLYPPLWGPDSYNDGAGMHRVITAAEFIRSNMPFGVATRSNPKLTDREAYDVAGYINSFGRPHKTGIENDYPDRLLKPVSTPYGPWADDFSETEHRYGPFPPIIAYYKDKYHISKTK